MGTGLVVAPHARAHADRSRRFGLGQTVAEPPRPQPLASLQERQAPQRVGGYLHLVGPMNAPTPLADGHTAKQVIVAAQPREDFIVQKMLRNIDNALRSAFPADDETAVSIRADGPDVGGLRFHVL